MPPTSCIQPFDRYLRITSSGTLASHDEVMEYLGLVVRMGREYHRSRILLDETRLTLLAELLDAYAFADSPLAREMIERGFRLACLPPPAQVQFLRSVETIMSNRSISFLVFLDEEEAIAWLTT